MLVPAATSLCSNSEVHRPSTRRDDRPLRLCHLVTGEKQRKSGWKWAK